MCAAKGMNQTLHKWSTGKQNGDTSSCSDRILKNSGSQSQQSRVANRIAVLVFNQARACHRVRRGLQRTCARCLPLLAPKKYPRCAMLNLVRHDEEDNHVKENIG